MKQRTVSRALVRRLLAIAAVPLFSALAIAQDIPSVPRNETLVVTPWGDRTGPLANLQNFNPYLVSLQHERDVLHMTVYEALFYKNFNTGETIPWLATGYDYNDAYTAVTLHLRKGVTWSDGKPFTSADVKYTLEALRDAPPQVNGAANFHENVKSVDTPDALTAVINLTKPAPRWVRDTFVTGIGAALYPILPAHIWKGKDLTTFTNFDLKNGWPVGTGAYRLVRATENQMVFDRWDGWWGAKTGFHALPAPKRVILVPVSGDDAMGQLFIGNQVDAGRALQVGTFEAAQAINPSLRTWHDSGPVWGAPDGCSYDLVFNNMKKPWDNPDLHWAVNFAINRSKLSEIGYEGAMPPTTFAFSSFIRNTYLKPDSPLRKVLDKWNADNPSQALVDKHMAAAGYSRNKDGVWAKDGKALDFLVRVPPQWQPLAAPLTQQLRNAGFDAHLAPFDNSSNQDLRMGAFNTMDFVHCGSLVEPVDTLRHFHSRMARPIGKPLPMLFAGTRYQNPKLDPIIDRMIAAPASSDPNSQYMKDAAAALDIIMHDLPEINLLEEMHVVTFNQTYWKGWPSAKDPYTAPFPPFAGFYYIIQQLKPAK